VFERIGDLLPFEGALGAAAAFAVEITELYCKYADRVIARGDKKSCSNTLWGAMNFDLAIKAGTKLDCFLKKLGCSGCCSVQ
jgi:hypothetical protein